MIINSKDLKSMKKSSEIMNDLTFTDYYNRLMLIARSRFKWTGLPNGIDENWIEKYLFYEGKCIFFKDKDKGFMVAKCTDSGMLNAYDEATRLTPVATNYTGESLENHIDCCIIKNNDIMFPTNMTIQLYAYKLANISRTIDVNVSAQKTPVIVLCSDKQKLSFKRAIQNTNDNDLIIYGDKNLDIENIKALKTEAPIVFDKLQTHKHCIWNEVMTFLGIDNANMDKKERLVDDEVQANNGQIEACCNVMLKARERACEEINKLFGTDIHVELREIKPEEVAMLKDGDKNVC